MTAALANRATSVLDRSTATRSSISLHRLNRHTGCREQGLFIPCARPSSRKVSLASSLLNALQLKAGVLFVCRNATKVPQH